MKTIIENIKVAFSDNAFLAVFFLATLLFFQNSWVPGFFHDGYLYAAFGKNAAQKGTWLIPHLGDYLYSEFYQHLPLAFITEGIFFKIFPVNFTTARIFGLIFPYAVVLHIYFSLKKKNPSWAFWAALLFCLIPPLLKKSRFPNIDTQLLFCFYFFQVYYWKAFERDKRIHWIIAGLFFGLAFLLKGPFALFLPGIVFLHLIVTRKLKGFTSLNPWLSLLIGVLIFSIWPISLKLIGRYEVFQIWLDSVLVHNALNTRDFQGTHWYDYIVFSIKQLPHLIIIYVLAMKSSWKNIKNYETFSGYFFIFYVLLISIPTVKYSNYMMMAYPSLVVCCGFYLSQKVSMKRQTTLENFFKITALTGFILLSIFPIGHKIRRDKEVFKILEITRSMKVKPALWLDVNGAYPYYALANMMGFMGEGDVYKLDLAGAEEVINGRRVFENDFLKPVSYSHDSRFLLLVPINEGMNLISKYKKQLIPLIKFDKKGFMVLVQRLEDPVILTNGAKIKIIGSKWSLNILIFLMDRYGFHPFPAAISTRAC